MKKNYNSKIYLGISLELLSAVWSQFSFRQLLIPVYTSSQVLQVPSNVASANCRVLICCTCHFQSGSLLFILASSFCKSLQYLTSALTQGGEGDHLFRLTCSIVLWGGRNPANKCHWRVWGVLAVSGPHWVCPAHGMCTFPVYTAQSLGCSAGELSNAGSGLHALPRSTLFKFMFLGTAERQTLGWACVF